MNSTFAAIIAYMSVELEPWRLRLVIVLTRYRETVPMLMNNPNFSEGENL